MTRTAEVADLPEILAALEENIVLARELGARSFELDRSLLAPLPERQASPKKPEQPPEPDVRASDPPQPRPRSAPPPVASAESAAGPADPPPQKRPAAEAETRKPLLILLAGKKMEGDAAPLFRKMVAAMGCAEGETGFKEIPPVPTAESAAELARHIEATAPKAIVLFGREAMRTLALAGGAAHKDAWGEFRGIPAIATIHPGYMLATWANSPESLRKAKLQVWGVLKEALLRVGRTPLRK